MRNTTRRTVIAAVLAVCGTSSITAPARAYDIFTEALEAHYGLKSVICKTCHPDNKDRTVHNALGHLVKKALAEQDLTARFEAAKAQGDAAKEAFEQEMAAELTAIWPQIAGQTMTVDQQFRLGLMNGTRLTGEAESALQQRLLEGAAADSGFSLPTFEADEATSQAE